MVYYRKFFFLTQIIIVAAVIGEVVDLYRSITFFFWLLITHYRDNL